jgi:hypothetical protein
MAAKDPLRWVWWSVAAIVLLLGWLFILWQNHFYVTPPTVVVCLGYLAVVATIANLWRVGAAAVAPEDATVEAWSRPLGERAELEKEKKTLLKAIKEAEFDYAMGKLSKVDYDGLIAMYRGRAIEVIKAIEHIDTGGATDRRTMIEREIAARLAVDAAAKKTKGKAKGKKAKGPAVRAEKFAAPPKAEDIETDDDVETTDDVETADDKVKTDDVATADDAVSTPADDRGEDAKEAQS